MLAPETTKTSLDPPMTPASQIATTDPHIPPTLTQRPPPLNTHTPHNVRPTIPHPHTVPHSITLIPVRQNYSRSIITFIAPNQVTAGK